MTRDRTTEQKALYILAYMKVLCDESNQQGTSVYDAVFYLTGDTSQGATVWWGEDGGHVHFAPRESSLSEWIDELFDVLLSSE